MDKTFLMPFNEDSGSKVAKEGEILNESVGRFEDRHLIAKPRRSSMSITRNHSDVSLELTDDWDTSSESDSFHSVENINKGHLGQRNKLRKQHKFQASHADLKARPVIKRKKHHSISESAHRNRKGSYNFQIKPNFMKKYYPFHSLKTKKLTPKGSPKAKVVKKTGYFSGKKYHYTLIIEVLITLICIIIGYFYNILHK